MDIIDLIEDKSTVGTRFALFNVVIPDYVSQISSIAVPYTDGIIRVKTKQNGDVIDNVDVTERKGKLNLLQTRLFDVKPNDVISFELELSGPHEKSLNEFGIFTVSKCDEKFIDKVFSYFNLNDPILYLTQECYRSEKWTIIKSSFILMSNDSPLTKLHFKIRGKKENGRYVTKNYSIDGYFETGGTKFNYNTFREFS